METEIKTILTVTVLGAEKVVAADLQADDPDHETILKILSRPKNSKADTEHSDCGNT